MTEYTHFDKMVEDGFLKGFEIVYDKDGITPLYMNITPIEPVKYVELKVEVNRVDKADKRYSPEST